MCVCADQYLHNICLSSSPLEAQRNLLCTFNNTGIIFDIIPILVILKEWMEGVYT